MAGASVDEEAGANFLFERKLYIFMKFVVAHFLLLL
jgi:hypothetical protein